MKANNSDIILKVRQLSKSFPGVQALENVDFDLHRKSVHCLIGANGAGKSTLVKILAGVQLPDKGQLWLDNEEVKFHEPIDAIKAGIKVIHQDLSLIENMTVAENIFLESYIKNSWGFIDWPQLNKKAHEFLQKMGLQIPVTQKVSELSMGHKQIVELCKAMLGNAKILIMDEPSSALSKEEFQVLVKVIADLKNQGITIVYISHRLEELYQVGDYISILRNGKKVFDGKMSELTMEEMVNKIVGHKRNMQTPKNFSEQKHCLNSQLQKEVILSVNNLSNKKLQNVCFDLRQGEILGFYGLIGSGRTETLRAVFGADPCKGQIIFNEKKVFFKSPRQAVKAGLGLIPEQRKIQGLVTGLTLWENFLMASWEKVLKQNAVICYQAIKKVSRFFINELQIKSRGAGSLVSELSGGNQQKVVIAKWLLKESQILFFDEPTQGIDVGAKEEIYEIIRSFPNLKVGVKSFLQKAVVVVSSEIKELELLCNRILVFYEGSVIKEFTKPFDTQAIMHVAVAGNR